jgi:hypothetical protein
MTTSIINTARREIAVLLYWTTNGSVVETINHFADALGNDFHPTIRQNPVLLNRMVQIDIEKHFFDTFHQRLTLFNPLESSLETQAQQAYNSFDSNTTLDLTHLERMLYPVSESEQFVESHLPLLNQEQRLRFCCRCSRK